MLPPRRQTHCRGLPLTTRGSRISSVVRFSDFLGPRRSAHGPGAGSRTRRRINPFPTRRRQHRRNGLRTGGAGRRGLSRLGGPTRRRGARPYHTGVRGARAAPPARVVLSLRQPPYRCREWRCEVSPIDTALFMAGVLTARQAFDHDDRITRAASTLYDRIDFQWMLNGHPHLLAMGWKDESGFLDARWDHYCELMVLYSPRHRIPDAQPAGGILDGVVPAEDDVWALPLRQLRGPVVRPPVLARVRGFSRPAGARDRHSLVRQFDHRDEGAQGVLSGSRQGISRVSRRPVGHQRLR